MKFLPFAQVKGYGASPLSVNSEGMGQENSFFKKQSERVIENTGLRKKQTENKAKTNLPKLLKTKEGPKKQTENKPKNKAGHIVENKASLKNKPKRTCLVDCDDLKN